MIDDGIKDELTKLIGEVCTVELALDSEAWAYVSARGVLSYCDDYDCNTLENDAFRIVCEHTNVTLARFFVDDVESIMQVGKSVKDIRLTPSAVAS